MANLFFLHIRGADSPIPNHMLGLLYHMLAVAHAQSMDCAALDRLYRLHPTTFLPPDRRSLPCDNKTSESSRRLTRAIPNEYIVVMRDNRTHVTTQPVQSAEYRADATPLPIVQVLTTRDRQSTGNGFVASIRRMYTNVFVGFSAFLSPNAVELVLEDPDVLLVEYDSTVSTHTDQVNPIWNLDRIDQTSMILNDRYDTGDLSGEGVHLYILDTGIASRHQEFVGRLGQGKSFVRNDPSWEDCNGHGTHCASTAAGTRWGVAKGATVHAVRVLNCEGSGAWSSIIGGLDWVIGESKRWPLTSVVSMSLGGDFSSVLNRAVESAVQQGVFVTVAAGNENKDACTTSPASEPLAVTVGSTAKGDTRSSFSNFGRCVDIYAPGSFIKAADYQSYTGSSILSGTSMATPHIAGTAALLVEDQQARADPMGVWATMRLRSTKGIPFSSSVFVRTPVRRREVPAPVPLPPAPDDDGRKGTCTTLDGRRCVFPFVFLGKRYAECTSDEDRDGRRWCSVRVDREGRHVRGDWGYCNPNTCNHMRITPAPTPDPTMPPTCRTTDGRACMLPFRFRGRTYTDCTTDTDPDGRHWCSTRTDARGRHLMGNWGYCAMSCLRSARALPPLSETEEGCRLYHSVNQLRVRLGKRPLTLDTRLQHRAREHAVATLAVSGADARADGGMLSFNTHVRADATVHSTIREWSTTAARREHMLCDDCSATGVAVVATSGELPRKVFVQTYAPAVHSPPPPAAQFRDAPVCAPPLCQTVDGDACALPTTHGGGLYRVCVRRRGSDWCRTAASPSVWGKCDAYTCNASASANANTNTPTTQLGSESFVDQTLRGSRVVASMRHSIRTLLVLGGVTVGVVAAVLLLAIRPHAIRTHRRDE